MKRPAHLKLGDEIRVISTARKISMQEIAPFKSRMEAEGFKISFGKNLFREDCQFAGTDMERAEDLQVALNDPNVKAICCARGGYGTLRIIDQIDFSQVIQNPKWIAGFSDVTAILIQLFQLGVESLHAPMPIYYHKGLSDSSHYSLVEALTGKDNYVVASPHALNQYGKASGRLIGGNLSILHNLVGTISDFDTEDCILFIEDLDEYLYHIDRMMIHLKRAGKLRNISGLIIGYLNDMHDNLIPFGKSAYEIILDVLDKKNIPVGFGFPIGHDAIHSTVVCGRQVELSVDTQGSKMGYI